MGSGRGLSSSLLHSLSLHTNGFASSVDTKQNWYVLLTQNKTLQTNQARIGYGGCKISIFGFFDFLFNCLDMQGTNNRYSVFFVCSEVDKIRKVSGKKLKFFLLRLIEQLKRQFLRRLM